MQITIIAITLPSFVDKLKFDFISNTKYKQGFFLIFIFKVQSYGDNRDFLSVIAPENVIT